MHNRRSLKRRPGSGASAAGPGRRRAVPERPAARKEAGVAAPGTALASPARASRGAPDNRRIGIALAGGGPLGGIYEIGALVALSEALEGLDFNDLDIYVGVSSGSFIAAGLANGLTPDQMCRMFIESRADDLPFDPQVLLKPALNEYLKRAASVPPLVLSSLWDYFTNPLTQNLFESLQRISRAIPTGVFDGTGMNELLARIFSAPGRTNDFRELERKLFLVATDLDTGESVEFGAPGYDHVPIATAVQASAALPGLFPPVDIEGRYFVDGALIKTLHASVALRQGATLVLCINPLVPFDSRLAAQHGHPKRHKLVEGGLPVVLSQTFRAIIHSRMRAGMGKYASEFKGADVVLFEPNRDDADMFFTNVFSYASRRRLSEHAYQKTRAELWRRRVELGEVLGRHGVRLRLDVLRDEDRRLLPSTLPKGRRNALAALTTRRLPRCLDELEQWLRRRRQVREAA